MFFLRISYVGSIFSMESLPLGIFRVAFREPYYSYSLTRETEESFQDFQ